MTAAGCSFRHGPAVPTMKNVLQIIPAEPGWSVAITETVRGRNAHMNHDAVVYPLIGWALTDSGMVEVLFMEPKGGGASTAGYYRQMNHDCGDGWSLTHRIEVVPRKDGDF